MWTKYKKRFAANQLILILKGFTQKKKTVCPLGRRFPEGGIG
jgi:hypothetical protein